MYPTRKYQSHEIPKVGDVIECFTGSFASSLITRTYVDKGETYFDLERPSASIHLGTLAVSIERIGHISEKKLREHYLVHTTGQSGNIENRDY